MDNRFQVTERFADGAQYIAGSLRSGTPDVPRPSWTRRPARRCTPTNWPARRTWTPPWTPPAGVPRLGGRHPGRALRRPAPLRRRARRAGRGPRPRRVAASAASRSSSARSSTYRGPIDNTAFFAGAARHLQGKAAGEYSRRPHLLRPPRAHRRRRLHRALELSAPDGRLEGPAGHRRGQHHRAQARRDHPAHLAAVRRRRRTEAGMPDGVVNIVTGAGRDAGEHLVGHPDVAMTSFTGSTAVGKRVAEIATGTVKRLHLELGGKAPFVVFDDADLEAAVHGAVAGSLINTGQDCTAATRAYVQRPLYDAFVSGVADLMATVRLGDPFDPATDLGPLVSHAQRDRVAGFVDRARAYATVVTGGEAPAGRAGQGRLLPAHPGRRGRPGQRDRPVRDLRPGAGGAALRHRRRGHRAGQRHPLRAGRLRLEPRRLPRRPRHPRDQGGLRLGQRPHPDHQRDAARRHTRPPASARTCRRTPSRSTRRSST